MLQQLGSDRDVAGEGPAIALISKIDEATPVANNTKAMAHVVRLSLWTKEMAMSVQSACNNSPAHLMMLTVDWLMMMR